MNVFVTCCISCCAQVSVSVLRLVMSQDEDDEDDFEDGDLGNGSGTQFLSQVIASVHTYY